MPLAMTVTAALGFLVVDGATDDRAEALERARREMVAEYFMVVKEEKRMRSDVRFVERRGGGWCVERKTTRRKSDDGTMSQ